MHHAVALPAVERPEALNWLGAVRLKDKGDKILPVALHQLVLLLLWQVWGDVEEVLALVLAKVQDFKGAVWLVLLFQFPLDTDQALSCGVDCKTAKVAGDPFPGKFFCNCRGCA